MAFRESIERHIRPLALRHQLALEQGAPGEVLLIGAGFALCICDDRDDVRLSLITVDQRCRWVLRYPADPLRAERATEEDYVLFGVPSGLDQYLGASMRVLASVLESRCTDILRGDLAWLREKIGRDRSVWKGERLSAPYAQLLGVPGQRQSR